MENINHTEPQDSKTLQEVEELLSFVDNEEVKTGIKNAVTTLVVQRAKAVKKLSERESLAEPQVLSKVEPQSSDDEWKKRMEFITTDGRDLDSEEANEVLAYAKGKGISYSEAKNAPIIQSYLSQRKDQKKAVDAQVDSDSSSPTGSQKLTVDRARQMTSDEIEKELRK